MISLFSSLRRVFLLALCCASTASVLAGQAAIPKPPSSQADDTKETIHGVVVSDPYQWLEDSKSSRTRNWLAAQQAYTSSLLGKRPEMDRLREEVFNVVNIEEPQRVFHRAGRYFILKKLPGHELASLYVQDASGKEQLLIDPNTWSSDHSSTMELLNVSKDGRLIAYSVRNGGRDQVSIHFYDTKTGHDLPDVLPEARYIYWSVPITPDAAIVFYIKVGDDGPRLYQHKFGNDISADPLLFGAELGPEKILLADVSEDGTVLLIHVLKGASGDIDVYLKDLRVGSEVKTVVQGKSANFIARAAGDHLYIQTNWNSPKGKVAVADLQHPEVDNWRTLIPEGSDTIESMDLVGGKLLLNYMKDAHSELRVFDAGGKAEGSVALPGLGTATSIEGEWDSPIVCFSYSSFQVPVTFFSYSLDAKKRTEISAPKVPAALNDVTVEQVWYSSKDGTKVPMFIARKKDVRRNGNAPTLLYGYGGFNWAQMPTFTPEVAVWLQLGGVYAVANIRGGNELGEAWHKAGSGAQKQNTFDDFIAAAEYLTNSGYTKPSRLAIQGLSNGGLLVTASITQRPDLFGAAIGRYPLIDMIRYERFSIARWWIPEYGSASDPAQFKTLYSYSPYHHVRKDAKYPAVLLITGEGDTRVDPSHARKMTAALQNTASERPILLLYDSKSGHSGTLSTADEVEQTASELTFLVWQLGVKY